MGSCTSTEAPFSVYLHNHLAYNSDLTEIRKSVDKSETTGNIVKTATTKSKSTEMAVLRKITSKALSEMVLLHPQPRISSCLFVVNKQNFSKGIVRLQDEESDPETQKKILKTLQESPHFKKTE